MQYYLRNVIPEGLLGVKKLSPLTKMLQLKLGSGLFYHTSAINSFDGNEKIFPRFFSISSSLLDPQQNSAYTRIHYLGDLLILNFYISNQDYFGVLLIIIHTKWSVSCKLFICIVFIAIFLG